jgi:hypothetical protein
MRLLELRARTVVQTGALFWCTISLPGFSVRCPLDGPRLTNLRLKQAQLALYSCLASVLQTRLQAKNCSGALAWKDHGIKHY